ncbi:MAG: HypC/HybG/HupF family hydrogenase formation chaperone [Bacteroidota bacterium]|nr:HypC/HybG/HupF family hydrogenase formation chaperone [Bacteroidota bacterium]
MCLAIPGKILSITQQLNDTFRFGKVSFGGVCKEVNLCMVPAAKEGDYVLVHVGVAIGIVDEAEAKQTFYYLEKMGETSELH